MKRIVSLLVVASFAGCASGEKCRALSTSTVCAVHDVAMQIQHVRLIAGSSVYLREFHGAMMRDFPNHGRAHFAEDHAMIFSREVKLPVCAQCTRAYDDWQAAHQQRPNQAPEPTALLVTPRAFARVAPSNAVAHL